METWFNRWDRPVGRSAVMTALVCVALGSWATQAAATVGKQPMFLRFGIGAAGSGQFLTASTNDGSSRQWLLPTSEVVEGKKIKADMDTAIDLSLGFGGGINDQLGWMLNVSYIPDSSTATVTTIANNTFQTKFSSNDIWLVEVMVSLDWVEAKNTPYIMGGLGFFSWGFDTPEGALYDLNTNGMNFVFAGGYRFNKFFIELRDSVLSLNEGSYTSYGANLGIKVSASALTHMFQLVAGMDFSFK